MTSDNARQNMSGGWKLPPVPTSVKPYLFEEIPDFPAGAIWSSLTGAAEIRSAYLQPLDSGHLRSMYIINNWSIRDRETRKGQLRVHLYGKVFGNPRFSPGEFISTSEVTRYRFETDSVVTRSGSEYRLGKPDSADPAAKRRLVLLLESVGSDDDAQERRQTEPAADQSILRV